MTHSGGQKTQHSAKKMESSINFISLISTCKSLALFAGESIREIYENAEGDEYKVLFEDKRTDKEIADYFAAKAKEFKQQDLKKSALLKKQILFNKAVDNAHYNQQSSFTIDAIDENVISDNSDNHQKNMNISVTEIESKVSAHHSNHQKKTSLRSLDPRTLADLSANEIIVSGIQTFFPGITIISEEADAEVNMNIGTKYLSQPNLHLFDDNGNRIEFNDDQKLLLRTLNEKDPKSLVIWIDPLDGTKVYHIFSSVSVLLVNVLGFIERRKKSSNCPDWHC